MDGSFQSYVTPTNRPCNRNPCKALEVSYDSCEIGECFCEKTTNRIGETEDFFMRFDYVGVSYDSFFCFVIGISLCLPAVAFGGVWSSCGSMFGQAGCTIVKKAACEKSTRRNITLYKLVYCLRLNFFAKYVCVSPTVCLFSTYFGSWLRVRGGLV